MRRNPSYYCLLCIYIFLLRAHPVRGESHILTQHHWRGCNSSYYIHLDTDTSSVSIVFIARSYLKSNVKNLHPIYHLPSHTQTVFKNDSDSSLGSLIVTRVESFCESRDSSRVTIFLNVTGVESESPKIVTRVELLSRVTLSLLLCIVFWEVGYPQFVSLVKCTRQQCIYIHNATTEVRFQPSQQKCSLGLLQAIPKHVSFILQFHNIIREIIYLWIRWFQVFSM